MYTLFASIPENLKAVIASLRLAMTDNYLQQRIISA